MTTATAVRISLEVDHEGACGDLARPLLLQLSEGYEECAVLPVPGSLEAWREARRTARKRAARAYRRGYHAGPLKRETWAEDMYEINVSRSHRQGRPMASGYRRREVMSPLPDYPCGRHCVRATGVWTDNGHLVAYLMMYRVGELALVSQILGHGDHERNEIMFLLFEDALRREIDQGGVVVYNRWDSGTDGLREFKSRLGFEPAGVVWAP